MPRKQRLSKHRPKGPTAAQAEHLLYGHDFFGLGYRNDDELLAAWDGNREEYLAAWVDARPGTRPWAWWRFEAPEPRRIVSGRARVAGEFFGLPDMATPGEMVAVYESEAAYLERLGLLTESAQDADAGLPGHIPGYCPIATAGDCTYSRRAADRIIAFFSLHTRHVAGEMAGEPIILEPWQRIILTTAFGWVRPNGTRRYRMLYVEIPRKNGKSILASAIALYMLLADGEPGAYVYSAAADQDQAKLVYNPAVIMVRGNEIVPPDPIMSQLATPFQAVHELRVPATDSLYKALSAEHKAKHGLNPHAILFDELHVQPDRELWNVLRTATGARVQPMTVAITTAGNDMHSLCGEQHRLAEQVRDGVINDPALLPVIYKAPDDADWTDSSTWAIANPNMGVSVREEYLATYCNECKLNPAEENKFRQLHLCQWVASITRWISLRAWDPLAEPAYAEADMAGLQCCGGLDLSAVSDITAMTLAFQWEDGVRLLPRFWAPKARAEYRSRTDRVPYLQWADEGWLKLTDRPSVDYDVILRDVLLMREQFDIQEIAVDRWQAEYLTQKFADAGLNVVKFGQGYASMSAPSKWMEALILNGKLWHAGHPILRWMMNNVTAERDAAGNIKPSKEKSTERIDGVVSTIMALGRLMVAEESWAAPEVIWL